MKIIKIYINNNSKYHINKIIVLVVVVLCLELALVDDFE